MHLGLHKGTKKGKNILRKKSNKKITDIEIGRILQMHDDKTWYVEIAESFNVHHFSISRLITRLKATGQSDGRRFNGHIRKTNKRTDVRIGREVLKDWFQTANQIKKDLHLENISLSTIYRRLHERTECDS